MVRKAANATVGMPISCATAALIMAVQGAKVLNPPLDIQCVVTGSATPRQRFGRANSRLTRCSAVSAPCSIICAWRDHRIDRIYKCSAVVQHGTVLAVGASAVLSKHQICLLLAVTRAVKVVIRLAIWVAKALIVFDIDVRYKYCWTCSICG